MAQPLNIFAEMPRALPHPLLAKIVDFLGQTVMVTGDVSEQNGMLVVSAESARVVGK